MNHISNSSFFTLSLPERVFVTSIAVLAITALVVATIGLTASPDGPFNAIVRFGETVNGTLLGGAIFIGIFDLVCFAWLRRRHVITDGDENSWLASDVDEAEEQIQDNNNKKATGFDSLPDEVLCHIFGFCTIESLGVSAQICKNWNRISQDSRTWRHFLPANSFFGPAEWKSHFQAKVRAPMLPFKEVIELLATGCPILSGSKIGDTHTLVFIPGTMNGNVPFTARNFQLLVRRVPNLKQQHGDVVCENTHLRKEHWHTRAKAQWVLFYRGTANTTADTDIHLDGYGDFQGRLKNANNRKIANLRYRAPTILEGVVCQYVQKCLGAGHSGHTYCKESYGSDSQCSVSGGTGASVLTVSPAYRVFSRGVVFRAVADPNLVRHE